MNVGGISNTTPCPLTIPSTSIILEESSLFSFKVNLTVYAENVDAVT